LPVPPSRRRPSSSSGCPWPLAPRQPRRWARGPSARSVQFPLYRSSSRCCSVIVDVAAGSRSPHRLRSRAGARRGH